ncbi:ubiquitin conjugating enzyme (UbcA) [Pochonia chlamydosporia 170]|uniref:Ubiquitin-conjugating enzyme E2 2 n=1 Tax=Pochonia chlamydosporia 170 TaxID=1380566 RepID=A0A179FMD8_METCM|nr:ubiquitin conjugating enzyme (UbcA) [Pochonia chlamydosporia 170]OAQ66331.1 ubiquitin conjugating enzyme (UbcA) [Pochonia chlamydosporia 170]
MTSSRDRRVAKELQDIQADRDNSGVYASPVDGVNLKHLKGTIPGPPDTPYHGGTFTIDIQIPDTYPFKSPSMKFDTKIWHPNVSSQTGAICLDTLGTGWSPVQTIKTALLSIRMLLEVPNPKDPQDAEVACMLMQQPEQFALVAQEWAIKHAGAPKKELDLSKYKATVTPRVDDINRYKGYSRDLVNRFVSMGFDVDAVVDAFLVVGINRNNGRDYELEEAYVGDITARLLGDE